MVINLALSSMIWADRDMAKFYIQNATWQLFWFCFFPWLQRRFFCIQILLLILLSAIVFRNFGNWIFSSLQKRKKIQIRRNRTFSFPGNLKSTFWSFQRKKKKNCPFLRISGTAMTESTVLWKSKVGKIEV